MSAPHPALLEVAAGRSLPPLSRTDVPALLISAAEHRMDGLLWTRVLAGELDLPGEATADLAKQDLLRQGHHLRLWRTCDQVGARLGAMGVGVVAAKGVAAERRWYARTGERPCNDLDLLLEPSAVQRVDDIVAALQPDHPLAGRAGRLMSSGLLQSIDLLVDGVEVDLHADLLKYEIPSRQTSRLLSSAVEVAGPFGTRVRALSAEHSLVHFLVHMNKDGFGRLLAYADVARILQAGPLDWETVEALADGEGLRVHVLSALHEVTHRLGLSAPPLPVPHGPRATVWRLMWPEHDRLAGRMSMVERRHRQLALPWIAERRLPEAAAWWVRRRVLPPEELVDLYYPGTSGPYLARLATGRWEVARRHRAHARALRSGAELPLETYKTFPPRWAHIQVPTSSRRGAQAALALYAPCLGSGYLVRDAAWRVVAALGPHALPGRAAPLRAPVPADQWRALLARWRSEIGRFDTVALHARPQAHRTGFAVLLLDTGRPIAFVRVRAGTFHRFAREVDVLERCAAAEVASFWHPRALAHDQVGPWSYLGMSAFPTDRHVAARPPLDDVLTDVRAALARLPRPAGTPDHWEPMHGDLTPWNCRDLSDGTRALIDWEDAAWGPPGADDVLFRATAAALARTRPAPGPQEAVLFWERRLAARAHPGTRESIGRSTLAALARMSG